MTRFDTFCITLFDRLSPLVRAAGAYIAILRRPARVISLVLSASLTMVAASSAYAAPNDGSSGNRTHGGSNVTGNADAARVASGMPTRTILVLGDSLSAGYGLPPNTGWVYLMSQRLASAPINEIHYSVVNGSISGDTSTGGRTRLPALLARTHPGIVIVELGSNDALRGIPMSLTHRNLDAIVDMALAAHAKVLLVGMRMPPNYGPAYTQAFADVFPAVATRAHISLAPFLLNGIADKPEMFQADQLHPLPDAQPVLLENVWKPLQPLL